MSLKPNLVMEPWCMAVFNSAVLAAGVVPSQDPLTLAAAILPVYGLYEATVQLSRWILHLEH